MIQLAGFFIFMLLGLFMDWRSTSFKSSILSLLVFVPALIGFLETLIILGISALF
jgi:hypothetical protein